MGSLFWSVSHGIFCCGIFVVERFVVESLLWNPSLLDICVGRFVCLFVVEPMLRNLCCGIFVVASLLWSISC